MANWEKRFDISDIWKQRNGECGPEDWTDKTVHELAKEIARRIKRYFPKQMVAGEQFDPTLIEVYCLFVSVPTQSDYRSLLSRMSKDEDVSDEEVCQIADYTPMKEFNDAMSSFYDWCDDNLVWVDK